MTERLSPEEAEHVIRFSSGPVRPLPERRFHELFEDNAERLADAVALRSGPTVRTYRQLNEDANRIAWSLLRSGLDPQDVVAVVTERTVLWAATVLGVLKAGGCYLPIDPAFPADRIAAVLDRSGCRRVLTDGELPALDEVLSSRTEIDRSPIAELIVADVPAGNPAVRVEAGHAAYIYFTSGSTGEPKGALCEHDGFLNHLYAKIEDLGIRPGDTVAQTAPPCFDISLWQLVAPWLAEGSTLLVGADDLFDVRRFVALMNTHRVAVAQLVPTYLDLLVAETPDGPAALPHLRTMAVTGEALKKELVRRWFGAFPGVPLVNCYGLTEVSDDTNHGVMHEVPEHRSVPLGPVVRNARVYVMDEQQRLVPIGTEGEIVMAGVCVGRGYVNDPERTAAVYGRDPYRPEDRLYRSGDFGRWLPSGELEYLGRRDSQVKVSGFRIEIGEIEDRLLRVPGVRDGAVVVAGTAEEPQLVAYYTGERAPDGAGVAAALGRSLPWYMVPPRLYHVEELPLSGNGKIDKKDLAARAKAEHTGIAEPRGATEQRVAAAWAQVLGVPLDRIGRDLGFTELGGTSLAAIRLAVALDRQVTVGDLRQRATVAEIAALLDERPGRVPVLRAGDVGDLRAAVRAELESSGAVLVRGLGVSTPQEVAKVAADLGVEAMIEREGFAPRTEHAPGLYSGSHWPAEDQMCMHHELSYAATVPSTLVFGCLTAPDSGGDTMLADSQRVLAELPPELVEPFEQHGWTVRRAYHEVGVSWQTAFGSGDPAEVDAYCEANGIEHEWQGDRLLTRQQRPAVLRHPRTGARGWFNQIAFLNRHTMDPAVRDYLTDVYGPDGLPFDTTVGDGSPVASETVETINAAYDRCSFSEPWQAGDVLVVDNLRMAHARQAYQGEREIVVVLGEQP